MLDICNNMDDLEGIMYAKWDKSEKDKYHRISLLCGICETKQRRKEPNQETDSWRKRTDGYQRGGREQDGLNRRWGLNGTLVLSTGWCMDLLSHYSVNLKLTEHCMLTILKLNIFKLFSPYLASMLLYPIRASNEKSSNISMLLKQRIEAAYWVTLSQYTENNGRGGKEAD